MRTTLLTFVSLAALAACGTITEQSVSASEDRRLAKLTVDRLEKFESEREFTDYLRRISAIAKERGEWWAYGGGVQYAMLDQPPCDPAKEACEDKRDPVVVTGSKISGPPANASSATEFMNYAPGLTTGETAAAGDATITNVQKVGVDEGDIVKRIGKFLVVLQDGRLFSIDTAPDGGEGLRLADRENVYTALTDDAWYDEILVTGNRVLVTGYNYYENATQLSVLNMDAQGRFTSEGTFFLSSNDYYDTSNYATRLVGDKLVIYSPIYLVDVAASDPIEWPLIRRWSGSPASKDPGKRMFGARDIYKPLQPTLTPAIHTVSTCDLGAEAMKQNLSCRTTAFVGPEAHTFYVSPDDVYVWVPTTDDVYADTCKAGDGSRYQDSVPAAVFKVPLSGAKPKVMMAKGFPRDQFGMDSSSGEMRALVGWGRSNCDPDAYDDDDKSVLHVKYFSAPLSMFRDDIRTAQSYRFIDAPSPGGMDYENRFTDGHIVYGGRESWRTHAPDEDEPPKSSKLTAIPVAHPRDAVVTTAPHSINRLERVGDDIVAMGYHDWKGLSVSMLDLNGPPKIASTLVMKDRYESEGRSHAFNSRLSEEGGLMGIPTVQRTEDSDRYWWWSDLSDVTFMSFDNTGQIAEAGALTGTKDSEDKSYACEVSCVDWYGNARPIFIGNRIYALTGTELVEGRLAEGKVLEVRRLNLTSPVK